MGKSNAQKAKEAAEKAAAAAKAPQPEQPAPTPEAATPQTAVPISPAGAGVDPDAEELVPQVGEEAPAQPVKASPPATKPPHASLEDRIAALIAEVAAEGAGGECPTSYHLLNDLGRAKAAASKRERITGKGKALG